MKLAVFSDHGVPSGYGRIAMELCIRMVARGHHVNGGSLAYDGLLLPMHGAVPLPYHVATLQNNPNWVAAFNACVNVWQPDIVVAIQDMPYAQAIAESKIDWSVIPLAIVTPVDGVPIFPGWIKLMQRAQGRMSISQFGRDAYARQGVAVKHLPMGVDLNGFRRLPADERKAVRDKLGIAFGGFVMGTVCQNQGRKAIPAMMRAFFKFAADKPDARYILWMDSSSPAGWDVETVCEQQGWDKDKLILREAAIGRGVVELNEAYNAMDLHVVLAHREGFGLPLLESMACGVATGAMDYCSGTEVVGSGRGLLINALPFTSIGTWGGAEDRFADEANMIDGMNLFYSNPAHRQVVADRGMEWARQRAWDAAADVFENELRQAIESFKAASPKPAP